MLIFISDLHFVDGTAGEHNFPCRAFEYFMEDAYEIVEKRSNKIKEIKLVFLGDTFDLLRTERWFVVPEDERPWGENRVKIEKHANDIFEAIVNHDQNPYTFQLLRSDLKKTFGLPFEPERIYIPGNHDRLCNEFLTLRRQVCRCLGLQHDSNDYFPHFYQEPVYRVLARHGHEYDPLNFAGRPNPGQVLSESEYAGVPIGDPIATELVSRLPWALDRRLEQQGYRPDLRDIIKRNFQEIDNVRPLYAVIDWLMYEVKTEEGLKKLSSARLDYGGRKELETIIDETLDQVIKDFQKMSFVRRWLRNTSWSTAVAFRISLFLLRKVQIFAAKSFLSFLIKKFSSPKDTLQQAAPSEFQSHPEYCYIVYGHTHEPLVVPLRSIEQPSPLAEVYLNTGTWRAQEYKATRDDSFVKWKNLTYVIFYQPGERPDDLPLFETWTGTLKSEESSSRGTVRGDGASPCP